jgi:hypothetical protein
MKSMLFMDGLRWAHFFAQHWHSGAVMPALDIARTVARVLGGVS